MDRVFPKGDPLYGYAPKLDFGSGHRPRAGYKTCDMTGSPCLDYYFNPSTYQIVNCPNETFGIIQLRNVVHHVPDLKKLFIELARVLKRDGRLVIVDSKPEAFPATFFLDVLWYRGIIPREEVWFTDHYRDYRKVLTECQLRFKMYSTQTEKEVCIATKI